MSSDIVFTKDNLDTYLKELAKEIRKSDRSGMPVEIILIGGAAILANYGFREMTTDIDAVFRAGYSLKDSINRVGDRYNLPNGWLNTDFMKTGSYSPKLVEVSKYYKTFSGVLEVRTVSAEYLIAMKLRAGREYKNDLSDIIGILAEHEKSGSLITMEQIDAAVMKLYSGWQEISADIRRFIEGVVANGQYSVMYDSVRAGEKEAKNILVQFEKDYPNTANENNVTNILETLKAKKSGGSKRVHFGQTEKTGNNTKETEAGTKQRSGIIREQELRDAKTRTLL